MRSPLLKHEVTVGKDSNGLDTIFCHSCQTFKTRHPLMTDDEIWEWKMREFNWLHKSIVTVDTRDQQG
ncbi:MAG: hypothetical protein ACYC1K_00300 [Minisyncoccota bacterium]